MRSVMKHDFAKIENAKIPRSTFNRSFGHKTAFDAGKLIPLMVDEILPGDTVNVNVNAFARLATPIFPLMDNMTLDLHWFFVPNRLVWSNWQKFCGEQEDPGDSCDYTIPVVTCPAGGYVEGTLADYMGLPIGIDNLDVNALPFRGFNLIFNDWYRDQNLQDSLSVAKGDGPDTYSSYAIKNRNKRHDYFTSCLPWPQADTYDEVTLPLGTSAPVSGDIIGGASAPSFKVTGGSVVSLAGTDASLQTTWSGDPTANGPAKWNAPNLSLDGVTADLSTATAATINELRQAFAVQKILERDARSGHRYVETLRSHFGVISPDARLQRPEILSTMSGRINISPVAQTSESGTGDALGTLAAIGTVGISGKSFTRSFVEHGYMFCIGSVRADLTYQYGIDKMWSRETRFDYYWPALQGLGEQAVLNKEIFAQGSAADENVFGYQEAWAEYRFQNSKITNAMRSTAATPLDEWHLSQEFATLPTLGETFIKEDPPVDRVVAIDTQPHFIFDSYFNIKHTRPMPVYSTPGLIDHF